MKKIKFYLVPSTDIRIHLESRLKVAESELADAQALNELRREELEQEALPALRQEYDQLVGMWETAPPKMKRRIRKPKLHEYNKAIIIYKRRTLWRLLIDLISWGIRDRDRWFEDKRIYLNNLYKFKHKRLSTREFSDRIGDLKWKLREFEGDWIEELTEHELKEIGMSTADYQCIRRSVQG